MVAQHLFLLYFLTAQQVNINMPEPLNKKFFKVKTSSKFNLERKKEMSLYFSTLKESNSRSSFI